MATASFILFPGPTMWRLARWHRGRCDLVDVPAGEVPARLAVLGQAGRPVVVAVPSDACLVARLATADLPRGDAKAMLYRFEDHLPVPAEQVVADFVPFDRPTAGGGGALGVCARLDRVGPAVATLEDAGVPVQAIVPAVLAAAQSILAADAGPSPVVLLLGDFTAAEPTVALIAVRDGRPVDWASLPATVADVRLHLALLSTELDAPHHLIAVGLPGDLTDELTDSLSQVVTVRDGAASDAVGFAAAAATGAAALAGTGRPWVDLRRGPLAVTDHLRQHRRPLNGALAAAAVAVAVTAVALFARSVRYDRAAAAADARARSDFRDHFPGWVMPTNVRAVVEGEHRRAAGGGGRGRATGDAYGSALATLRDLLAGLPPAGRFAIDRLSVSDDGFELSGRVAAYDQVDAVVAGVVAAARRAGLVVPTPQSRREAGGTWSFGVQGTRPPRPAVAVAEPRWTP